jgi:transposase
VKRGDGTIEPVFCWAHCRRRLYEFHAATKSPLAAEALAQIARLYAIEAEIRGQPPEHRRAIRQQRSRPIVEALQTWLKATLARVSGSSPLADAIGDSVALAPHGVVGGSVVRLADGAGRDHRRGACGA